MKRTRAQLLSKINTYITSNSNEEITGALLNDLLVDINDSLENLTDDVLLFGLREFSESKPYLFEEGVIKSGLIYQCTNPSGVLAGIWNPANFTVLSADSSAFELLVNKDTDATLSANSDIKYPSQKAVKAYADTKQSALGFTPENIANKNQNNGYAGLDSTGKVAAAQLPSYVDDVLEVANYAALPGTGETGKIYVTLDTNYEYRWSGSVYIQLVASPGSTDAVPEGSTNLYFTENRVRGTFLTGIGFAINRAIIAGDKIIDAFGILQAQISAIVLPTKATATELNTGTDDAKFATALALENSKYLTQAGSKLAATASGTDTYTASITPALTAYSNTNRFYIKFTNANTGAATLNLNSLGAIAIKKNVSVALVSGDILAGQVICLAYDGTNFQMLGSSSLGYTAENVANKDAIGGYAGLTLFKINFKNVANTFTSFFTNSNTAARTYTFPDKSANIVTDDDSRGVAKSASWTVLATENGVTYNVTTGASALTCTYPTGTAGFIFYIRKIDSGAGVIITSVASITMTRQYQVMQLAYNGSTWDATIVDEGIIPTGSVMGNMSGATDYAAEISTVDIHDVNQKAFNYAQNGFSFDWLTGIFFRQYRAKTVTGVTKTSILSTTAGDYIGAASNPLRVAANSIVSGKALKLTIRGKYTSIGTGDTFLVEVIIGSVTLTSTTPITIGTIFTNQYFEIEYLIQFLDTGASGSVLGLGEFKVINSASPAPSSFALVDTYTAKTLDTTIDNDITVKVQHSDASGSCTNSMTTFERLA